MRRPSVSRSETLPQAEFTSAEDVQSAQRAPKRAVRVWETALERGAYTIGDETKEQTEFNLGKNFL